MDKEPVETVEVRKMKDAILKEIFDAYRESGALYKKVDDSQSRQALLDMKRGFDLIIRQLSPSEVFSEKLLEDLRSPF
jgi:hypothetical protein